ncbi:hypothetical protein MMC25_002494 [Agyrium rufum]|nr:hypothetical protein [Agyrium rufum]
MSLKRKREGNASDDVENLRQRSPSQGPAIGNLDGPVQVTITQGTQNPELAQDIKSEVTNGHKTTLRTSTLSKDGVDSLDITQQNLPTEMWQRVFCLVPPMSLGRLLRVNRLFNSILTPEDNPNAIENLSTTGISSGLTPQDIWLASRRKFCPGLPRSLPDLSELQMWRLLRGNDCQSCGERKHLYTVHGSANPWESGPGSDGVRVFWAFGIRSCGRCMRKTSEKEDHLVASNILRSQSQPGDIQLTKVFYKPQIEVMKNRVQHVIREVGTAAADEWIKGLDKEGRSKAEDVLRWENWEAKGGLEKVNARPQPRKPSAAAKRTSKSVNLGTNTDALRGPVTPDVSQKIAQERSMRQLELQPHSVTTSISSQISTPLLIMESQLPPSYASLPSRQERNIRDIDEAKASRRAEIERRCINLVPPIPPNVLQHMESFKAALSLITPMNDSAWDVLMPRLLAQREVAERRETERSQHHLVLNGRTDDWRQQDSISKETKELLEKEWEAAQAPIRQRLSAYADEMTQQNWSGGQSITKDNISKFAADVLLFSRERFYEDQAKQDATLIAAGGELMEDPPDGPPTRRLILENMKWLYDHKIKPMTEAHQRELFLCNGSGCETTFKFYGFEGVIQHYAAKHTSSFSQGSIVVHWRADWPEQPPFHPNPNAAKENYYAASSLMQETPSGANGHQQVMPGLYATYSQNGVSISQASLNYPHMPFAPVPAPLQYQGDSQPVTQQQEPFASYPPPPRDSGHNQAYASNGHYTQNATSQQAEGYGRGYSSYTPSSEAVVSQVSYAPTNGAFPEISPQGSVPKGTNGRVSQPQHNPYAVVTLPPKHMTLGNHSLQGTDLYNLQLEELANHAREVWFATSGVKDMPQSVRIYVVIQQVAAKFAKKYTNEPGLAMFLDGLNRVAAMRPVRSVNGLNCRSCLLNNPRQNAEGQPIANLVSNKKAFTLPLLLNHFKNFHLEPSNTPEDKSESYDPTLDWKIDMVELPEIEAITSLVHAPGMDVKKLHLVTDVFPGLFPVPAQRPSYSTHQISATTRTGVHSDTLPAYQDARIESIYPRTEEYPPNATRYEIPLSRPLSRLKDASPSTARASEPPGEDEYDPHRPAFLDRMVQRMASNSTVQPLSNDAPDGKLPYHVQEDRTHLPERSDNKIQETLPFQQLSNYPAAPMVPGSKSRVIELRGPHENPYASKQTNVIPEPYQYQAKTRQGDSSYQFFNTQRPGTAIDRHHETTSKSFAPVPGPYVFPGADTNDAEQFLRNFEANVIARHENQFSDTGQKQDMTSLPPRSPPQKNHPISRYPHPEPESMSRDHAYLSETGVRGQKNRYPPLRSVRGDISDMVQVQPIAVEYRATTVPQAPPRAAPASLEQPADLYNRSSYRHIGVQSVHATQNLHERNPDHSMGRYYRTEPGPDTHYRERSRSPHVIALPPGPYRGGGPSPPSEGQYYYQAPFPVAQREARAAQPIYYDYPPGPEEVTYIREVEQYQERPRQRVEHIPMPEGEYATAPQERYVVAAQPDMAHRGLVEHVRYVRNYANDQAYQQNTEVYYREPPTNDLRDNRPTYSPAPEYAAPRRYG